ncbi:MAG: hypothetical protein R3F56_23250 [Planctomycetota bacterium]
MRIVLFHFHAASGAEAADALAAAGHDVTLFTEGKGFAALDAAAPDVIVIDLRRMPSHGRAVAFALRQRQRSRHLPLVFVEGVPERTTRLRDEVPDAVWTPWTKVEAALARARRTAPKVPVVPKSTSGYSGTPLPKKLGVKPGSTVLLLGAPDDFVTTLGALPDGARVVSRAPAAADVIVVFAGKARDLTARLAKALPRLADGGALWLAWPKRASGVVTDVTEALVRTTGLATGLVDTKVGALDVVWSGLQFRRRRTQ